MVYLLLMKLLKVMASSKSLKVWQYFITNKVLNVSNRRFLMVYFTSNWLLAYAVSVILECCYRKNNSNIAQFAGYITYIKITKHVDFILGDFNKDSFSDGSVKISLQSFGFSQVVSEANHFISSCLDQTYIKKCKTSFPFWDKSQPSLLFSDHDLVFLYYDT